MPVGNKDLRYKTQTNISDGGRSMKHTVEILTVEEEDSYA